MVRPGAPEVLKWFSQNVKMEAPSPPNGNPEESKGPAAEGVALKIRRTPAGGAGREWIFSPFCRI